METNTIQQPQEQILERLTPKDLVRKHIADPTHKITEEEFDRLIVGVYSSPLVKKEIETHS